ncbi:hypothetical protein [Armatimonas sp.]|uniref:hypothetical protein n=1 Tax=Armatimonas sp. TaxID=1872638 RepID=UPI00286B5C75|nr:hypothetical protein [Armatimonas sp.]
MSNDDWLDVLGEGATGPTGVATERALRTWRSQTKPYSRAWLLLAPTAAIFMGGTVFFLRPVNVPQILPPGSPRLATLRLREGFVAQANHPLRSEERAKAGAGRRFSGGERINKGGERQVKYTASLPIRRPLGIADDLHFINVEQGPSALAPEVLEQRSFIVVPVPLVASETSAAMALALEQAKAEAQIVDTRLQKRVTLAAKALAFGDLCRELSEKTGVSLEASRAVADDKLTVFCTGRSLRDTMRQVSAIFGFVWERTGDEGAYKYRLTQPLRGRLAEEELRNKDAHDALVALDEELSRLGKYENETPEQLLARADQTDDPAKKRQLQNLAMRSSGPMRLYNQLSPDDMKALQAGKKLEFSSNPKKPGEQALPAGITQSVLTAFADRGRVIVGADGKVEVNVNDDMSTRGPRTGEGQSPATLPGATALSWLQLKRDELGQVSLYGGSGFGFGEGANENYMVCNAPVAEGRSPSHKPDNAKENAALLKEPALARKTATVPKTSGELTTGELLEKFHQLTGMDVMGDSFTGLYPSELLNKSTGGTLHALLSKVSDGLNLRWRYEKPSPDEARGLLRFRTTDFFNRRPQEIANRWITRWEQARKSEGALGSELLCEVARLSDEQLDSRANAQYLTERSKLREWRWVTGLKEHWRLLAALGAPQRTQALESGVPLSTLGFELQERFLSNVFAHSTSSSQEWPALEWQRDARFEVRYTPMNATEEEPKLVFSYRGLRRSQTGAPLVYTEDQRFNRYGPRPEK